jgi:hypothetical protein
MASLQIDRPVPIETQPADEPAGLHRVLVRLDGSTPAEPVIIGAVSPIARSLDREIVLLRVVPSMPAPVIDGGRPIVVDSTKRLRDEATDYL